MNEELPEGWQWSTLADVAEWGSGGTPKKTESSYFNGDIPWVLSGDLEDGEIRSARQTISQDGLENSSAKLIEPGSVLVAMYGATIGQLGIVREPVSCNQAIAFAKPHIDTKYLFYYLMSQRDRLRAAGKGAAQKNISQTVLKSWPIPVAPAADQARIVAVIEEHLSRLDAAESSLEEAARRCQTLRRRVIVEAVPVAAERPEWTWTTVGEAGVSGLGRQRSPKNHQGPNMRPYLRVANVFEGRIDTTDVMSMNFEPGEFERFKLRNGDILLNEGQTPELLGRPAIYRGEPADVAFTNSLIRFVPCEGVSAEWALLVFRRHMHAGRFKKESKITTNIAHLALGRFRTVEFPVPPRQIQDQIVARTRAALDILEKQELQIHRAVAEGRALRRAILSVALSGRFLDQQPGIDSPGRTESLV